VGSLIGLIIMSFMLSRVSKINPLENRKKTIKAIVDSR
jgi:hypothetical protein